MPAATLRRRSRKPFEVTSRRRHSSVRMKDAMAAVEAQEAIERGVQSLWDGRGALPESSEKHSAAFVNYVMEVATGESDPSTAREFAQTFLAKPASYSTTPAGLSALMLEVWLLRHGDRLFKQFVETILQGTNSYYVIFDGPVTGQDLTKMQAQVGGFIKEMKPIVKAGDLSQETLMVSDLTIFEVTPVSGLRAPSKKDAPSDAVSTDIGHAQSTVKPFTPPARPYQTTPESVSEGREDIPGLRKTTTMEACETCKWFEFPFRGKVGGCRLYDARVHYREMCDEWEGGGVKTASEDPVPAHRRVFDSGLTRSPVGSWALFEAPVADGPAETVIVAEGRSWALERSLEEVVELVDALAECYPDNLSEECDRVIEHALAELGQDEGRSVENHDDMATLLAEDATDIRDASIEARMQMRKLVEAAKAKDSAEPEDEEPEDEEPEDEEPEDEPEAKKLSPKKKAPPPPPKAKDDGEDDEEETTDRMDEPEFYREDLQAYYDMLTTGGATEKEALTKVRRKFKVKKVIVTPAGEVRSPGVVERPASEKPTPVPTGGGDDGGEPPFDGEPGPDEEPAPEETAEARHLPPGGMDLTSKASKGSARPKVAYGAVDGNRIVFLSASEQAAKKFADLMGNLRVVKNPKGWEAQWAQLGEDACCEHCREMAADEPIEEADYDGEKVQLNQPRRAKGGDKKFEVFVKNDKGNVVKVSFGDPDMEIKRDDPERRRNFRARHNCDDPGPKWKARYWSCKMWQKGKSVSDVLDSVAPKAARQFARRAGVQAEDADRMWSRAEQIGEDTWSTFRRIVGMAYANRMRRAPGTVEEGFFAWLALDTDSLLFETWMLDSFPEFEPHLRDWSPRDIHERIERVRLTHDQVERYEKWKRIVNMSPKDIRLFHRTHEATTSVSVGGFRAFNLGAASSRKLLSMKMKRPEDWSDEEWNWSGRQLNTIRRLTAQSGGLFDSEGAPTEKLLLLRAWGHNPLRHTPIDEAEVIVRQRKRVEDVWVCPSCEREIIEKSLYYDPDSGWEHRACGAALNLPESQDDLRRAANRLIDSVPTHDRTPRFVGDLLEYSTDGVPEFTTLKKGKVPLTPEEREKCLRSEAVWHYGNQGAPSPAVWRAEVNGKTWYVTNTHRAYNATKTLNGAIRRYHDFIKSTA